MNIRRIELEDFTVHKKADLELPTNGVVCITGGNGRGKSSFLEGVCWTLWGKTLRGTDPVPAGKRASTRVTFEGSAHIFKFTKPGQSVATPMGWAERARKGSGSAQVSFGAVTMQMPAEYHPPEQTYETATKAQAALELVVGGFDVWRRAQVFSSSDASLFTLATDGERKRLLESILGLDRFDPALEKCRARMRTIQARETQLRLDLARQRGMLAEAVARQSEAERGMRELGDSGCHAAAREVADLVTSESATIAAGLEAQAAFAEARDRHQHLEHGMRELQGSCNHADQRARRLAQLGDVCPTCEQAVPAGHRSGVESGLAAEREGLAASVGEAKRAVDAHRAKLDAATRSLNQAVDAGSALQQRIALAKQRLEAAARLENAHQRAAEVVSSAGATAAACHQAIMSAEDELDGVLAELAEQQAVEKVLGLRGVRAHLLSQALGGLAAAANSWLEMIAGGGLRVKLDPYTEKKTGGMTDAISLEIGGAGGGHGYRAASGGERRRIDVALMLALADVARAARGLTGGTMFFDEVFDALDEAGMDAVCEAMQDLSKDRCVVVISHSPELVKRLSPVKHVKL